MTSHGTPSAANESTPSHEVNDANSHQTVIELKKAILAKLACAIEWLENRGELDDARQERLDKMRTSKVRIEDLLKRS